ncbi:MAG: hypothetical protein QOJ42_5849 [Acidobacteriaceae bacterium]|jgi:catechol 2,3-dioxygenase-like lactoylglutathione lyase family enzyme|nr:hypothetical protein [Acidobacteriaceae bacterium]MDX6461059.1 hypothetical protein [Acidobacteriaceae bacterium]
MLDHMILTVSNVERSLAFYEAALKPLNIQFFLPYKGDRAVHTSQMSTPPSVSARLSSGSPRSHA